MEDWKQALTLYLNSLEVIQTKEGPKRLFDVSHFPEGISTEEVVTFIETFPFPQ